MVWFYVVSYVFVVGCMVYWSWRAKKAEAQVAKLMMITKALVEQASKVIELSDEIINEENIVEHEEDC